MSKHTKLSEVQATSISGNDILSSVLYVSGIAALFAGVYAPLVLLLVVGVLYLYKSVYTEAVEALPVNGGAYNALLNASSKLFAATAGVMTILSYVATAVISAKVAIEYIAYGFNLHEELIIPSTILLLLAFALLVISGIKDSAKVAMTIFFTHLLTLTLFIVLGAIYFFTHDGQLQFNFNETTSMIVANGGLLKTLFLAFSASLLGVSGFESSANFVEEQKKGVFRKTLRNMLIGVAIFNPIIAFLVLNSLPMETVVTAQDFLLAFSAETIGGNAFKMLLVVDAFLVLSGAVLTAYVGVSGLISRMASDNVLPGFLSKVNKKGSHTRIVVSFFLLCSSILILTGGELLSLAGVYTISFLGVMTLFAVGTLILRKTRPDLERTYHAPVLFVILAGTATFIGIIGNVMISPENLTFFLTYFVPTFILVLIVMYQEYILTALMKLTKGNKKLNNLIYKYFDDAIDGNYLVFVKKPDQLYKALKYLNQNENGRNINIVHCMSSSEKEFKAADKELHSLLPLFDKAKIFSQLKLNFICRKEEFGPKTVKKVAEELEIPLNRVLIGSIEKRHPFSYDEFGGVRIIF